jgi:hypothetical protein
MRVYAVGGAVGKIKIYVISASAVAFKFAGISNRLIAFYRSILPLTYYKKYAYDNSEHGYKYFL